VHASDADQAEALLTRWGPDGLGKLGGELSPFPERISLFFTIITPVRPTLGYTHQGSSTSDEPGSRN
jgi:hypothetical protein